MHICSNNRENFKRCFWRDVEYRMMRKNESFHGCWRFDEIKIIVLKRTNSISMWSKVYSIRHLQLQLQKHGFRLNTSGASFVCSNSDHSIGKIIKTRIREINLHIAILSIRRFFRWNNKKKVGHSRWRSVKKDQW